MRGRVELREALGSEIMVHFTIEAPPAVTEDVRELARDVGDESTVDAKAEASHTTMVGRFGPRTEVREGDVIEVAVDTRSLHFFDPETGDGYLQGARLHERSWDMRRFRLGAGARRDRGRARARARRLRRRRRRRGRGRRGAAVPSPCSRCGAAARRKPSTRCSPSSRPTPASRRSTRPRVTSCR